jgi:hypothetical protein
MNAPHYGYQEEQNIDYQVDYSRDSNNRAKKGRTSNRPQYARSGNRPSAFNGIHRRRNKRFSW